MNWLNKISWKNRLTKLTQWEYWPMYTFYAPLLAYYAFEAIRFRHPFFMTAVNPGLFTGGTGMESKYTTIMMLPEELRPRTILVRAGEEFNKVVELMQGEKLVYPVIAKPDVGYRGLLVKKIKNEAELKNYLQKYDIDFLIQELITLPEEGGVHYHKFPGEKGGRITSVTLKEFLSVTGDGISTVLELVQQYDRALLQIERLRENFSEILDTVPEKGQVVPLGAIGNHSKGTAFINGNYLIDKEMEEAYGEIVNQLKDVYYCRFDLKFENTDDLKKASNLKVIEINGICAEPTHIYDPGNISYFGAVATIARHWKIITQLARVNNKSGVTYMDIGEMFAAIRKHFAYIKKINKISAT